MRTTIYYTLFSVLTFSCMNKSPQYEYADGSANVYRITNSTLNFIPIKPEESSSGTFSGGVPKTVQLTSSQFDEIRTVMEQGIGNARIHIVDRVKMSGVITVINGKHQRQYILKPNCTELQAIEKVLKRY